METTPPSTSTNAVKVVWSDGSKQLVLSSSVTVGQLLSELRCRSPASTADGFHVAADTPLAALRDTPLHLTADNSSNTTSSVDSSALPSPPGHLFLVRSDVRYLLTDAWLVNSLGSWHGVNRHWVLLSTLLSPLLFSSLFSSLLYSSLFFSSLLFCSSLFSSSLYSSLFSFLLFLSSLLIRCPRAVLPTCSAQHRSPPLALTLCGALRAGLPAPHLHSPFLTSATRQDWDLALTTT